MKKLLLLSLVVFGLVVVSAAQAKFHWNVKCQKVHIKGYKLRKGTDCAHVLTKGKTWKFPKGTNSARMFTPAGKILAIKFLGISKGTPLYSIGPGGKYGKVLEGEAPVWVKSSKAMVVLAATKSIPLQQP